MENINNYIDENLNLSESINKYKDFFDNYEPASILIITDAIKYKSDLISFNSFNTEDYWWLILLTNDLISNDELITGLKIKLYPKTVYDSFLELIRREETN